MATRKAIHPVKKRAPKAKTAKSKSMMGTIKKNIKNKDFKR